MHFSKKPDQQSNHSQRQRFEPKERKDHDTGLDSPPRFGASSLHQRDSRSALFEGYNGDAASRRPVSASPNRGYGYGGYGAPSPSPLGQGGFDASRPAPYRSATPNKRGQYSDAVLNELESQNDAQVEGILGKVKVLKN
ncbi:blocked early in transport 1, partial [Fusarium heterosporum]